MATEIGALNTRVSDPLHISSVLCATQARIFLLQLYLGAHLLADLDKEALLKGQAIMVGTQEGTRTPTNGFLVPSIQFHLIPKRMDLFWEDLAHLGRCFWSYLLYSVTENQQEIAALAMMMDERAYKMLSFWEQDAILNSNKGPLLICTVLLRKIPPRKTFQGGWNRCISLG